MPQGSVCSCSLQPARGGDSNRASAPRWLSFSTLCAGGTPWASSPQHCRSRPWDRYLPVPFTAWWDPPALLPSRGLACPSASLGTACWWARANWCHWTHSGGGHRPPAVPAQALCVQSEGEHYWPCSSPQTVLFSRVLPPPIPTSYFSRVLINPSLQISLPRPVCLSIHPPLGILLTPLSGCISIPRAGADRPLLGTSLGLFLVGQHAQPHRPATPSWSQKLFAAARISQAFPPFACSPSPASLLPPPGTASPFPKSPPTSPPSQADFCALSPKCCIVQAAQQPQYIS